MIALKTTMLGFGPFSKTTSVNWGDDNLVCLCASNGSGKTFMIEGDFACLYGYFPSRGRLNQAITQGWQGESFIESTFAVNGIVYQAVRKLGSQHTAMLSRGDTVLAGPKVRDFEEYVDSNFGDRNVALATWFSAQGMRGDLADATPTERMSILSSLLDLNKLDDIHKAASEFRRNLESKVYALETLQKELGEPVDVVSMQDKANQLRAQIEGLKFTLNNNTEACKTLRDDLEKAVEAERNERDKSRLEDDLAGLLAKASNIQHYLGIENELKGFESRYVELAAINERHKSNLKMRDAIARAEQRLSELRREMTEEEMRELDGLTDHLNSLDKKITEDERKQRELESSMAIAESEISARTREFERIKERISTRPQTPGGDVCELCPLLSDFKGLSIEALKVEAKITELEMVCIGLKAQIDAGRVALNALRESLRLLDARRFDLFVCARDHETRGKIMEDISRYKSQLDESACDVSQELRDVQMNIHRFGDIRKALASAQAAHDQIPSVVAKIDAIHIEAHEPSDKIRYMLAGLEHSVKEQTQVISIHTHSQQALEFTINQETAKRNRLAEISNDLDAIGKRLGVAKNLERCFSPKGVRQLILDQSLPMLDDIADDMLRVATGGKFRMRIYTQKETASGLQESLTIMVSNGSEDRELSTYSGGERRILQTVLRMSMGILQSKIRGIPCEHFRSDEAFDALDEDNGPALVNMFRELSTQYRQIICVSHSASIAALFGKVIRL